MLRASGPVDVELQAVCRSGIGYIKNKDEVIPRRRIAENLSRNQPIPRAVIAAEVQLVVRAKISSRESTSITGAEQVVCTGELGSSDPHGNGPLFPVAGGNRLPIQMVAVGAVKSAAIIYVIRIFKFFACT